MIKHRCLVEYREKRTKHKVRIELELEFGEVLPKKGLFLKLADLSQQALSTNPINQAYWQINDANKVFLSINSSRNNLIASHFKILEIYHA